MVRSFRFAALALAFLVPLGCAAAATKSRPGAAAQTGRTKIDRGVNLFSKEDDVELGREAAAEAEKELVLLDDPVLTAYIDGIGQRVAAVSMEPEYPYEFKIVDSSEINAFALPGGFIYLNRGILERAESEGEVAGVLAHEVAHAALRHGTNQVTKQILIQVPLALVTGLVIKDDSGWKGGLARLGIQIGATGLFLSYSRKAETQADVAATQALYDTGYDPTAMASFFAKLQLEHGRSPGKLERFFSSHPVPENREKRVNEEVGRLGPPKAVFRDDRSAFARMKDRLAALPPAPAPGKPGKSGRAEPARRPPAAVPAPSGRWSGFESADGALAGRVPSNWRVVEEGDSVWIVGPPEGYDQRSGNLTHGLRVRFDRRPAGPGRDELEAALDAEVDAIVRGHAGFRERRRARDWIELDGEEAIRTILSGPDGRGGEEVVALLVRPDPRRRRGGSVVVRAVGPAQDVDAWAPAIDRAIDGLRFP